MSSAVLASHNESNWAHMGKMPYPPNSHLNSNPNPNPKKKQKQFHHNATTTNGGGGGGRYHRTNVNNSPAVTQTASDDAYSFNQTSTSRGAVGKSGKYSTYNVSSCSRTELFDLRQRLAVELGQIQNLRQQIESNHFSINVDPRSQPKLKKNPGNKHPPSALFGSNGNLGTMNFDALFAECGKIVGKLLKQKSGYIFKSPVDVKGLKLVDYHAIVKRPMDLGTVKSNLANKLYRTPNEFADDVRLIFDNAMLYNPAHDLVYLAAQQMLSIFEDLFRPVQEKYSNILKQRREMEYQEYNEYNKVNNEELTYQGGVEELQGSSWNNNSQKIRASPPRGKKMKPKLSPVPLPQVSKKLMQMPVQAHSSASTPSHPPHSSLSPQQITQQPLIQEPMHPSPVREPPPMPAKEQKVIGRVAVVKQPKPRAKDQNKREMNMEEKQKLGIGLQSLPQEKMPHLVQIIKKRNEQLAQDGDEIELDIEALDVETLWELDRFVTNWKKMVSKTKRQALMNTNTPAGGVAAPSTPYDDADMGAMSDKNEDDSGKKFKDNDDEDVDIDDDMPATSFPPVEIEKDEGAGVGGGGGQEHDNNEERGNAAASSSSSSSGSSSSDSSSSSGIDTDSSCVSTLC